MSNNLGVKAALLKWTLECGFLALLAAGFHYWLRFTDAQSLTLGILFGVMALHLRTFGKRTGANEEFIPYRVSIRIHDQRELLFKSGLVRSEEEWKTLCERVNDKSILRRGLNFTVLSLGKNGLPHLIWWDDHKTFLAGIPSFEDHIQGLDFPFREGMVLSEFSRWSPRLYFGYRHGTRSGGYTLSLCVKDDWWAKNKVDGLETEKDHYGSIYITFGALPYGEIGLDYDTRGQHRNQELEKMGWVTRDFHEPEAPWLNTIEVQNEYFSVSQQFLETD